MNDLNNFTAVIPSYNPDEKLLKVISDLLASGFKKIIVVNDGSLASTENYFETAEKLGCTVLTHETNKGKGAAIKTALKYFLSSGDDSIGVVTVDGDDQHRAEDVVSCCGAMAESHALVLGVRDFSQPDVPPRSKAGNRITRFVFRTFCGLKISDTQTGLRVFPAEYIEKLLYIEGERYEYETNMLLHIKPLGLLTEEVKIKTVYINENDSSHFRTVRDSIRIYGLILKYLCSSLISAAVDWWMFLLLSLLLSESFGDYRVLVCTAASRVVSSVLNYTINRGIFQCRSNLSATILKYYTLAVFIMAASGLSVFLLSLLFGNNLPVVQAVLKIPVDIVLFTASFRIQREWVFKN